jgi:hypothetical protein
MNRGAPSDPQYALSGRRHEIKENPMFRISITKSALALSAVALALPAGASAGSVDVAAKLEAHAVLDSGKALRQVRSSAEKARDSVDRSAASLKRAYAITIAQGQQSSAKGLEAATQFSVAARAQGDNLEALVEKAKGGLKTAAADALAKTGRMEADLVARVAKGLEQQQASTSAQQGEDVADVGSAQASLTASIVVTASGDNLRRKVRGQLDQVTALALRAQARLVQAVAELRKRSEGQGQAGMASAQSSLAQDGEKLNETVRRSGRADVTFSADSNGNVTMGDLSQRTVDAGSDSPASASAQGEAHVAVDRGGRR